MLYTYNYDSAYIPSMPVIELLIGRAQVTPVLQITAIVDSGADATMIPVSYLKQIGARKGKQAFVRCSWLKDRYHPRRRCCAALDAQGETADHKAYVRQHAQVAEPFNL